MNKRFFLSAVLPVILAPSISLACACGCGVFDVGGNMFPTDVGGTAWLSYDFMNQNNNWSHASSSPSVNDSDKKIRSNFIAAGAEYMFNSSWGIMTQVPYTYRYFKTTDDGGDIQGFNHSAFGDVHVEGIYSGFESDMSTGLTFGFKLPTGNWKYANFDRDVEVGSGSTDLLLGGYHIGSLTANNEFSWFVSGLLDKPFEAQDDYRPGTEFDAATGISYNAGQIYGKGRLAPLVQLLGSVRGRDSGLNADPADTGYDRILVAPGIEYDINNIKLYSDVEVPVYQYVNGNQLVAPVLLKFTIAYSF